MKRNRTLNKQNTIEREGGVWESYTPYLKNYEKATVVKMVW